MQLHHHISTPLTYFYDPSYKYVTTTYCDPADDVAQLWTFNTTSNMIFTANDTNRCLSMVPNAANLNLDLFCQDAKVKDGHIPLLSRSNRFHFFLSKHEKRKKIALQIADALKDAGFKVWVSQHEASHGNPTDKDAMQLGVKLSESILLLMTQGIFHRDRFWVVKTEVMYGIEECHKPLICVTPVDHNKGFDFDTKVSGVEEKCISF